MLTKLKLPALLLVVLAGVIWLQIHNRNVLAGAKLKFSADSAEAVREGFYRGVRVHDSLAQRRVDSLRRVANISLRRADSTQVAYDSMLATLHTIDGGYVPLATVQAFADTAGAIIFALRTAHRKMGLALEFATLRADSLRVALDSAEAMHRRTEVELQKAIARLHPPLLSFRRLHPSVNAGLGTKGWDVQLGVSYQF